MPGRKHLSQQHGSAGPDWQRPTGVPAGNWDYLTSRAIAAGYAESLKDDPLTKADGSLLDRYLPAREDHGSQADPDHVADFGCGNGRSLIPLLDRGYRVTGFDLSLPMLAQCVAAAQTVRADRWTMIQSNLVDLSHIRSQVFDAAICLFSTLGMIQGRAHRQVFLQHVARTLKPGRPFLVHAHNLWFQTRHPGGIRWMASSLGQSLWGPLEWGDRTADYRGVRDLTIHSFRRRELNRDLRAVGLRPIRWWGIQPGCHEVVGILPRASNFRLVGWIVECRTAR